MSAEEGKAFVMRVLETVNAGRLEEYGEWASSSYVGHGSRATMNLEEAKRGHAAMRIGLPDLQVTAEEVLSCGDRLVVRLRWSGTHKGTFMGKAATGKRIEWRSINIWRTSAGKITEEWWASDDLGVI